MYNTLTVQLVPHVCFSLKVYEKNYKSAGSIIGLLTFMKCAAAATIICTSSVSERKCHTCRDVTVLQKIVGGEGEQTVQCKDCNAVQQLHTVREHRRRGWWVGTWKWEELNVHMEWRDYQNSNEDIFRREEKIKP